MARSQARPLTTVEAVLIAAFAYVVLLITLTGARLSREPDPAVEPRPDAITVIQVASVRPVGSVARGGRATCVTARTTPYFYAASPDVTEPLAFGPPVEAGGQLSTAAVNGALIERLCYRPDPRLFAALAAAVNGGDPNRPLSRAEWTAGVNRFVTRDGLFVDARVVTRTVPLRTPTYGMRVPRGADPVVLRTRLARADTSRYLVLPVRSARGPVVTLTLRLRCGFQPIF